MNFCWFFFSPLKIYFFSGDSRRTKNSRNEDVKWGKKEQERETIEGINLLIWKKEKVWSTERSLYNFCVMFTWGKLRCICSSEDAVMNTNHYLCTTRTLTLLWLNFHFICRQFDSLHNYLASFINSSIFIRLISVIYALHNQIT